MLGVYRFTESTPLNALYDLKNFYCVRNSATILQIGNFQLPLWRKLSTGLSNVVNFALSPLENYITARPLAWMYEGHTKSSAQ